MNSAPSISACIPCFDAEKTLRSAAESIRGQSVRVQELLIIDDGSKDRSPEIADEIADRWIRFRTNGGRGNARHRAIEELESEYVLFCDATVALEPTFVERALEEFANERVAGVFGQVRDPAPGSFVARWRAKHLFKTEAKQQVDRKASLMTGGALLKRSAVIAAGNFDPRLRAGEDQELGERLLGAGYEVTFDPALRLTALQEDGVMDLMRRYTRWNCAPGHVPSWLEYCRSIFYHAGLARRDLAAGDFRGTLLTVFAPHFIFWSRRWRRQSFRDKTGHSLVKAA